MNENLKYGAAAVVVVGLSVGGGLYLSRNDRVVPPEKPVVAIPAKPMPPAEPEIAHPLPSTPAEVALPSLVDSDQPMQSALESVIGKESVERFVIPKDLVRHIVVSIDNLPDQKVAERIRPVKPTPGKFATGGSEEAPVLDPANYDRYKPLVQLFIATDTQQLVTTYTRYYPLFQEAYDTLGHPPKYFNDRLIAVIDHLLSAPDPEAPIALAQPGVLFEFADPKLETRSAGQKLLIRMGSENAAAVKNKLRELRTQLIAQQPGN
jgi:hypothetical protein